MKKLSELKTKLNLSTPHIQWKFIVFDYNEHEVDFVKNNYLKLGFDSYSLESDSSAETTPNKSYTSTYKKDLKARKKVCFWLW